MQTSPKGGLKVLPALADVGPCEWRRRNNEPIVRPSTSLGRTSACQLGNYGGGGRGNRCRRGSRELRNVDTLIRTQDDHEGEQGGEDEAESEVNPKAKLTVTTEEGDEIREEDINEQSRNHGNDGWELTWTNKRAKTKNDGENDLKRP